MAFNPKGAKELQVFRGSKPKADVFARTAGDCCGPVSTEYDKLDCRVRFDNSLSHLNPTGGNERFHFQKQRFPVETKDAQIKWLNDNGVGAQLAIITIPTFAFVTDVSVVVLASEPGLTFKLVTRNGLALPDYTQIRVDVAGGSCCPTRTRGGAMDINSWGQLPTGVTEQYLFFRDAAGQFSLESDELLVEVVTMPTSGTIAGTFDFIVGVSYDVVNRAEQ